MKDLLAESLAEGAWGYSTGLEYAQEAGATEDGGDRALPRARAARRPLRDAHAPPRRGRDRLGRRGDPGGDRRRACGSRSRTSCRGTGSRRRAARRSSSRRARGRGLDVEFDMHTRLYGLTHLYAALPPWALAEEPARAGRAPARSRRPATGCGRTAASSAPATTGAGSSCSTTRSGPSTRGGTSPRSRPSAARSRSTPSTTCCSAALEAPHRLMVIIHAYTEEEQREAFAHPLCVPGSDATTLAPDGPLADTWFHGAYTWASWFYRFMVRDEGLLTPGRGRAQADGQPAARLGLSRPRACSRPGAARRRRRLRPRALRRARDDVRAEPARRRHGARPRQRRAHAPRRRLTGERGGAVLRR